MMISYSANLEDVMLNRVFRDVDYGFYVDIGSHRAYDGSNTAALYHRGWKGIVCDPIYNLEPLWAHEWHALRPRDIIVRDMICDEEGGEGEFYICNYRGLSTGAKHILDYQRKINGAHIKEGGTKVPRTTLNRVLSKCFNGGTLHLVCIDVEGMEEKVLRGIDLQKYKPWVFVIESVFSFSGEPSYGNWEPLLFEHGYDCVYDDRMNRFYLHRDQPQLKDHFIYPPNVLDGYKTFREWELERRLSEYESTRPLMER
jgi:FkbM family methyltransferase